ncbi:dihydroxyacetone kinase phosphoryl donor subunit DhaM [Pengzhenrongella frigida]|uniref:Phosphocarrier protein HPr n=1 Tax=Pengzhenrongella frigida TaxID=1259133 RepID=A0A4Q5N102_9MICO|nr:dihydroxyacetone kinase phosphoryl donor subunit DhaM [Cellulomonas sp. HLT2-17]RYV51758.1 HPr family phosphocarrier protein [Cellulomonas sp. HLT2-17]
MTAPVEAASTGGDAGRAPVALLLVSHSRDLAAGTLELAAQMAPSVLLVAAGGLEDGGIGTSYDLIEAGLGRAADGGRSVVILTDLGSAVLTAESVLEFLDDEVRARVRLADAPFVEGSIAAAVAADGGQDVEAVLGAAELAGATFARSGGAAPSEHGPVPASMRATAVLRNPLGLHARPAAQLARTAASFEAVVTVNGVDAASVLALIGLGAVGGQQVVVTAAGPQARAALVAVIDEIEAGFGEA